MSARLFQGSHFFPTDASDGRLRIHIGSYIVEMPIPNKGTFDYDDTHYFGQGVMCYLENSERKIIIRFDGTYTEYTKDNVIIGKNKVNLENVDLSNLTVLVKGTVGDSEENLYDYDGVSTCTIYYIKSLRKAVLISGIVESMLEIDIDSNPNFLKELESPNKYYPYILVENNTWKVYNPQTDSIKYLLSGEETYYGPSEFVY